MSFPSSVQNSFQRNKENMNPNYRRTGPTSHIKLSNIRQSRSIGSQAQMLSIFKTIHQSKTQSGQKQVKMMIKSLYNQSSKLKSYPFLDVLCLAFGRNHLSLSEAIDLCEKFNIEDKSDVMKMMEGEVQKLRKKDDNINRLLKTDLGTLKIEQLIICLRQDKELKGYHYEILQNLLPLDLEEDITAQVVEEAYKLFKQGLQMQAAEEVHLHKSCQLIIEKKITSRLWNDHFRTTLTNSITAATEKQKITHKSFVKIMTNILSQNEIGDVFKYLYYVQTKTNMPIVDRTKKITAKLLFSEFFTSKQAEIAEVSNSPCKNTYREYALEESQKMIKSLMKQKQKMLEQLTEKSSQIDRLNKIIDFQRLQIEQERKSGEDRVRMEVEGCKRKYNKIVDDLRKGNQQKRTLIEWYQRELQGVGNKLNMQNVEMWNFKRDSEFWQKH